MAEPITVYVGCDLGDKFSHLCLLDPTGAVVQRARLRTSVDAFRAWFGLCPRAQVTMEVGTHSRWASRVVRELGHEVLVANARNVQLISRSQRKTDKRDAETLARLGRFDPFLLGPIQHRGEQAQTDLLIVKARDGLVAVRTRLVTHIRGIVKPFGLRVPKCETDAFAARARATLPAAILERLEPVLETIAQLTAQIAAYAKQIEYLARERYPETNRLRQVDRVGAITSLAFVLTLDDPARFKKSRTVGAYLGLTGRKFQSGDSDPELRITKAGDPLVRRLLVQCAQQILNCGQDSDLRRWGLALAARGKRAARKRAVVAVARKLGVLLHRLWVSGAQYEPLRGAQGVAAVA